MKQYLDQQGVEYLWGRIKRNFANLSNNGKVPASQLPSYIDDVEEYESLSSFPSQGEEGKIYVAKNTNLTYRWSGSTYVEISQSIALGETSSTAYPGDKGKQLSEDLKAEIGRSNHEDASIRETIAAEQNRAETSEKNNRGLIQKNASDIAIETNNRISGDEALSVSINAEKDARQDADDNEKIARQEADATEKAAREAADTEIKNSITQAGQSSTAALNAEIQRAKEAEATITSNLSRHTSDYENPHHVTKAQVGLDNVDNTSDINKPISTATQTELNKKANQTDVNQLQQTITNLQTTIQQLYSQITNMSTTIESVQNNITNMQTTINTLPTVDSNDAKYLRKDKNDVTPYTITAKALYKA